MFENIADLSLAVNGITYFNQIMHFDIADAANQLTNYMGTTYLITILAAALADTYLGRFRAVLISACIEFFGLGLLAIQAYYAKLRPPSCNIFDPTADCVHLHGGNAVLFFVALYMIAVGGGGMKSALPSHGADQFEDDDPKESLQRSTFFNWFLLYICIGGAISLTLIVWIQDHKGWGLGFGLCTMTMLVGILVLVGGLPLYRIHEVKGSSAITEIIQVYVAAFRNRNLPLPEDSANLYEISLDNEGIINEEEFLPHSGSLRFLDKAAIQISSADFEKPNPWRLCRVTQVENAKIMLRILPIFCCTIMMTVCLAQLQTFFVEQGTTMDTSITKNFQIPPASLPIIPIICLIIAIPVYDQIVVPFIRKFTGIPTGITYLQRIGVGLVLASLSFAVAAIIEVKRKSVARSHNMLDAIPVVQPLPISVFWLGFQYFIFGIADMFTYVGGLEFFYAQAPQKLKSVSSCFQWTSMALGYFLSTIVVKIVNRATKNLTASKGWLAGNNINKNHLNLFYWLLSALSILNFGVYLFFARRYKYRPDSGMMKKTKVDKFEKVEPQSQEELSVSAMDIQLLPKSTQTLG
ncbi:OLC1v1022044C2 [Oldenlandia corymbosa var. corymbosa]|nr:OLC1v1022044C2 [Oldenlandia corymbosa var. corymbosa]